MRLGAALQTRLQPIPSPALPPPCPRPCRQQAALVSKRFAALCCSPTLLRDVYAFICGMPDLDSFLSWLKAHGPHIRRLQFTVVPAQGEAKSNDAAVQRSLAAANCLATAGSTGKLEELEELELYWEAANTGCGLPAMRSLQRATLFGSGTLSLVYISPAIAGATALQSLKLCGDKLQFAAGARLPSGITRLWASFDGNLQGVKDMPNQVSGTCLSALLGHLPGHLPVQLTVAVVVVAATSCTTTSCRLPIPCSFSSCRTCSACSWTPAGIQPAA